MVTLKLEQLNGKTRADQNSTHSETEIHATLVKPILI